MSSSQNEFVNGHEQLTLSGLEFDAGIREIVGDNSKEYSLKSDKTPISPHIIDALHDSEFSDATSRDPYGTGVQRALDIIKTRGENLADQTIGKPVSPEDKAALAKLGDISSSKLKEEEDWRLSAETRAIGLRGVEAARSKLGEGKLN